MDSDALKPILAGLVRHGLTTLGGALVTGGYMQSSDTAAFIGGGMVLAGMVWSWWQKQGQAQVSALLKKLTATKTKADAVKAAEVLPPSAAVDTSLKSASVKSVVNVLLVAFALSLFLAGAPAFAQAPLKLRPIMTDDAGTKKCLIPWDPLKLCGELTGKPDEDMQRVVKRIQGIGRDDLNYAILKAKVANTNGSGVRLQCLNAIMAAKNAAEGVDIKDANGSVIPRPDPAVVTLIEDVAELIDALSPQGPLMTGCAGAAQLFKTNTLAAINAIVTGSAALAAGAL